MSLLRMLLIVGCGVLAFSNAQAHDPGLSQVELNIKEQQILVHLVFANKDIESLINLDTNQNTQVSEAEFKAGEKKLKSFIIQSFQLSSDNTVLVANGVNIVRDKSEAIHFNMTYPRVNPTQLTIHSNMLQRFSLGHRQFLKIVDANSLVTTRILSARMPEVIIEISKEEWWPTLHDFIVEGIWHIWIGYDHILFLVTLFLPIILLINQPNKQNQSDLRTMFLHIFKVITAFTVAHSLALVLSTFNFINLSGQIVEPLIALSIIIAASNNIFNIFSWQSRELWLMTFIFGVIHGFGFASVLQEIGLNENPLIALFSFNIGIEIGQIVIILFTLPLLYWLSFGRYFRPVLLVQKGSWVIVAIASFWLIQRTPLQQFLVSNNYI